MPLTVAGSGFVWGAPFLTCDLLYCGCPFITPAAEPEMADPTVVWRRYSEGCSLRVLHPQRWCDPLWLVLARLEAYLQCCVGCNACELSAAVVTRVVGLVACLVLRWHMPCLRRAVTHRAAASGRAWGVWHPSAEQLCALRCRRSDASRHTGLCPPLGKMGWDSHGAQRSAAEA